MYSKKKITLETLLASRYEARSITQVSTPAKLRDERAIFPEASPPWQLTGNNIAGRNAPRARPDEEKKMTMQPTFHAILNFEEWWRLLERKEEVSAICWHSLAMEGQLL